MNRLLTALMNLAIWLMPPNCKAWGQRSWGTTPTKWTASLQLAFFPDDRVICGGEGTQSEL